LIVTCSNDRCPRIASSSWVSWGELQGLDFAVAEAKRFGIRLILSLVNGNPTWGGKQQYVEWAQEYAGIYLPDEDSFFTDPTIISWYKNFVKVNSIASLASCSIS
jgi:mannan endo-1,4-beta-mannosidase